MADSGRESIDLIKEAGFIVREHTANAARTTCGRVMDHRDGRRILLTTTFDDVEFLRAEALNTRRPQGMKTISTMDGLWDLLTS